MGAGGGGGEGEGGSGRTNGWRGGGGQGGWAGRTKEATTVKVFSDGRPGGRAEEFGAGDNASLADNALEVVKLQPLLLHLGLVLHGGLHEPVHLRRVGERGEVFNG